MKQPARITALPGKDTPAFCWGGCTAQAGAPGMTARQQELQCHGHAAGGTDGESRGWGHLSSQCSGPAWGAPRLPQCHPATRLCREVRGPSALIGAVRGNANRVVGLTASSPSPRARGFALSTNHFAALGSYSLFRVTASHPVWSQPNRGQVTRCPPCSLGPP